MVHFNFFKLPSPAAKKILHNRPLAKAVAKVINEKWNEISYEKITVIEAGDTRVGVSSIKLF
jgi:hypothetical protein